jgi:hypothetical protein
MRERSRPSKNKREEERVLNLDLTVFSGNVMEIVLIFGGPAI